VTAILGRQIRASERSLNIDILRSGGDLIGSKFETLFAEDFFGLHSYSESFNLDALIYILVKIAGDTVMGKLLKVLTVIILLLSVAAFVMGLSNFKKRELLIGRTQALEEKIIQISMTLEEKEPVFDGISNYPERDIDEVSDRQLESPNRSDFWSDYNESLEVTGTPPLDLRGEPSRIQLRTYYQLDSEGKVVLDIQKRPRTAGPGTMEELLDKVLDRAGAQLRRLNATRAQLRLARQELVSVIEMLNEEKRVHRSDLQSIAKLKQEIDQQKLKIRDLETQISRLEREKSELNDSINELRVTVAEKDEQLVAYDVQVKRLNLEIDRLSMMDRSGDKGSGVVEGAVQLTAGIKGSVAHVNKEWAYVLVKLTPEAAAEIKAGGTFSPVEMMVHRKTAEDEVIVTRLRIITPPNKDNVVIADNMYGWEQMPVEAGDIVIY